MLGTIVNSIGIVINMIGVWMIFKNSPFNEKITFGYVGPSREDVKNRNAKITQGVFWVLGGCLLQLVGNLIQLAQ